MTDRTIFNRTHTQFAPQGTSVYLVNGGLKATASGFNPTIDIIAGENLEQGQALYVSGVGASGSIEPRVYRASAAASQDLYKANVIGFVDTDALQGQACTVDVDGVVTVPGNKITGETSLSPGKYYYLSEYLGEITRYATTSGNIERPDYHASAPLGVAVTTTSLTIEIGAPTFLV